MAGKAMSFILLVFCLSACNGNEVSATLRPKKGCWEILDTVYFNFLNSGMSEKYKLAFEGSFSGEYKYRNLYLGLKVKSPSGLTNTITLPLEMMDDEGNWLGKTKANGAGFFASDLSRPEIFQEQGNYLFGLYHYMQDSLLCGVENIRFSIEKER